VLAAPACTASLDPAGTGFDSGNPSDRLAAIGDAARAGDSSPEALRPLVEQLDCEDAAVRLMAIATLERLTGETFGYGHADPSILREQAIRRWQVFLHEKTQTPADPAGASHG